MSALARTGVELGRAAREARAGWDARATIACAAIAVAALVPPLTGLPASLDTLAGGLYLGVAAVGLGLVAGLAGLPSLAQGAFVGVGAFAAAVVRTRLGFPLAPAVLTGAVAAALAGRLVGELTVRLPPALFAVATLLVSWLALEALQAFPSLFGGAEGIAVSPALAPAVHYELALALVVLSVLGFLALARAGAGLGLQAARARRAAAVAAGVPVHVLQRRTCTLAAGIAGVAGALAVDVAGVADPSAYGPELSLTLLLAVLIGGAASALGGPLGIAVLGAVSVIGEHAAGFSDALAARIQTVLAAVIVLALLPDDPEGLLPAIERRLGVRRIARPASVPLVSTRSPAAVRAEGLSKHYGTTAALDGLELDIEAGSVHAIIGRNGSGKSTALRALAGTLTLDAGRITVDGDDITHEPVQSRVARGIVRTLQSAGAISGLTVLENALVGTATRGRAGGLARSMLATPRQRAEAARLTATAYQALSRVGLQHRAGELADTLSATEQRLLAIATVLAGDPGILLLDEPSSGIGAAELGQLQRVVRESGITTVIVEHNLRFVRAIADRVTVLDAGRAIVTGTPAQIEHDPRVRSVYLGAA